jgi:hypothetical protein
MVSSCAPRAPLPDALWQAPTRYAQTAEAARQATREAERAGSSAVKIIPLGTLAATGGADDPGPTAVAETPAPPVDSPLATPADAPAMAETATPATTVAAAPGEDRSVVTVRTAVMTQTATATSRVIVVRATPTPAPTASAPAESSRSNAAPPLPQGLVETQDVITGAMLAEQIMRDTQDRGGDSLSELVIELNADGIHAAGALAIFPGVTRPLEASGTFAVENESLVVQVFSIHFDGVDVTERYGGQLESQVNSSLYRLLPQRYVQSFEMEDGRVIVRSKMRP